MSNDLILKLIRPNPKTKIDVDHLHKLIQEKSRSTKVPDIACASAIGLADVMPLNGNAIWPIPIATHFTGVVYELVNMAKLVGMDVTNIKSNNLTLSLNQRKFHFITHRRFEWIRGHTWDGIVHTGNEWKYPEELTRYLNRTAETYDLAFAGLDDQP
jgi:hypothetical protein